MSLSVSDAMKALRLFASEENLYVVLKRTNPTGKRIKNNFTGNCSGALGRALGESLSPFVSGVTALGYRPLSSLIRDLPRQKQGELAKLINGVASDFEPQDPLTLLVLVKRSREFRVDIVTSLKGFFEHELNGNLN